MFTVCPKCTLTLAVTAGDLRTGQGYVRCGRCSNVFNALLTLSEQPPDASPSPAPAPVASNSTDNVKPAAAPARPSQPTSEASSIQIDQLLMLGGSAFPRSQAAGERGTQAALSRRSANPPKRPPGAAPAAATTKTNSAHAEVRETAGAKAGADSNKSAVEEDLQVESGDITGQFELPHRAREAPAQATSKAVPRATSARAPPTAKAASPSRTREPASIGETELERGGDEAFETRTVETIVLEGDGFTQTKEFVSEEQAGLAALRREIENLGDEGGMGASGTRGAHSSARASSSSGARRRTRGAQLPGRQAVAGESAEAPDSDSADPDASSDEAASAIQFAFGARSLRYRGAWLSGAVALVLLLLLQAMNHWREALAASPAVGSMVTRTYAAFGVPLEPHWDLTAYEVRQQGAQADPKDAHVIHVRLSLANHAPRAQPVPLLRLTLLDRYGKRIARRDLAPNEYWPRGRTRQSFLNADQRIDSEVAVRDPNADSASFELDVCLRGGERLHCAMDSAPATANILTP